MKYPCQLIIKIQAGLRKKFDDIFSRLNTIHQRDGQREGRTPGDS